MTKTEFQTILQKKLENHGISPSETQKSLDFYLEMIDDRIEDGMPEKKAVAALGDIDALVKEILLDVPLGVLVKNKIKPKREFSKGERTWLIILAIIGFPIWGALLIGAIAVCLSIYIAIFALILSAVCVVVSFFATAVALIVLAFTYMSTSVTNMLMIFSTSLILVGIALLLIIPTKYAVLGLIKLIKLTSRGIKSLFIHKERSNLT